MLAVRGPGTGAGASDRDPLPVSERGRVALPLEAEDRWYGPYLLDLEVTHDGVLLTTGVLADDAQRGSLVVSPDGSARAWTFPRDGGGRVLDVRRQLPARVGGRLFVPAGRGGFAVPVEAPR